MSIKQELEDYLFSLPSNYTKRRAHPGFTRVYTELDRADKDFREIIWGLIISDDPLSLCSLNSKGLLIKKENGGTCQVNDNKSFVCNIFSIIHECYFEHEPLIYKWKLLEKVFDLPRLYDYFDEILDRSAKTPDYKSVKRKHGVKYQPTRQAIRNYLQDQTSKLIERLRKTPAKEMYMWKADRKINEKILIYQLYRCFKNSCDNDKMNNKDIFYNIAKVTLLLGTHARSEQVRNDELVINHSFISTERRRVEKIYDRFKLSIKK